MASPSTFERQQSDRADRADRRVDQRKNAAFKRMYEIGRRAGAGRPNQSDVTAAAALLERYPDAATPYELGFADGSEPVRPAGRGPSTGAGVRGTRPPAARRPRGRPASPVVRTAQKNLWRPVRSQLVTGSQILGLVAAVLLLSAMLRTADTWTGVARKIGDGFDWLASPHRSIPYGPNFHP